MVKCSLNLENLKILEAHNITKHYAKHVALDNVSISIPKQSIFGLLGPNGAGKTTLLRIINQIIEPDSGSLFVNNEKLNLSHINLIGYLPEERGLYKKMKVGEQLLYFGQLRGLSRRLAKERSEFWLKRLQLFEWWGKKVEDLSKGMAQKVQFIATVMHDPQIIILDEPFSGFDPVNANLIKDEILELRDRGSTIIFSTHRMESVEQLCDHIAMVHQSKKILDGSKSEIKDAYKSNTYQVAHNGFFNSLGDDFEIVAQQEVGDNTFSSTIKIKHGTRPNALLHELLQHVEIHSFVEEVPSINDIFISKVQGGGYA